MNYFIFIPIIFIFINVVEVTNSEPHKQQEQQLQQPIENSANLKVSKTSTVTDDKITSETRRAIMEQLNEFRFAAENVRDELRNLMVTYASSDDRSKRLRRQSIDNILARFRKEAAREKELTRLYRSVQADPDFKNSLAIGRLKLLVKQRETKSKEPKMKSVKNQLEGNKATPKLKQVQNNRHENKFRTNKNEKLTMDWRLSDAGNEPNYKSPKKYYNRVDIMQWIGQPKNNEEEVDEALFQKNLAIIHSAPSLYGSDSIENRNNLSHEANYKLSKIEQEEAEKKKKPFYPSVHIPYGKREVQFNPMNEIKLKTSTRLMRKGFGPSLPSYSLSETRREMMLDNMIKRLENDMNVKHKTEDDNPENWNMRFVPFETQNFDYQTYRLGSSNYDRKPQRTTEMDKQLFNMWSNTNRLGYNDLRADKSRLKRKIIDVHEDKKPNLEEAGISKETTVERLIETAAENKNIVSLIDNIKKGSNGLVTTKSTAGTKLSKLRVRSPVEVNPFLGPSTTAPVLLRTKQDHADNLEEQQSVARIKQGVVFGQQIKMNSNNSDAITARLRRFSQVAPYFQRRADRSVKRDCAINKMELHPYKRKIRRKRATQKLGHCSEHIRKTPKMKHLFMGNAKTDKALGITKINDNDLINTDHLARLSEEHLNMLCNEMMSSDAVSLKADCVQQQKEKRADSNHSTDGIMTIPAQITLTHQMRDQLLKATGLTYEQLQLLQAQQRAYPVHQAFTAVQVEQPQEQDQKQAQYQKLLMLQQQVNDLVNPQQQPKQTQNAAAQSNTLLGQEGSPTLLGATDANPVQINFVLNAQLIENKTNKNVNGNGEMQVKSALRSDDQSQNNDGDRLLEYQYSKETRGRRNVYDMSGFDGQKFQRKACSDNASNGLISGKVSAEIVSKIFEHVRADPELNILWPSLQSNRPIGKDQMESFCAIRQKESESVRQRTDDALNKAVDKATDITAQQIRACNSVLRADLLQFYDLILSTYADMEQARSKRNDQSVVENNLSKEINQVDSSKIQDKTHIVKKLLQQYEKLNSEEQEEAAELRNDLLKDLDYLSNEPLGYRSLSNDASEESETLTLVVPIKADNEEILRFQQEEGLTPQYLRLIKTTELMRDAAMQQQK